MAITVHVTRFKSMYFKLKYFTHVKWVNAQASELLRTQWKWSPAISDTAGRRHASESNAENVTWHLLLLCDENK